MHVIFKYLDSLLFFCNVCMFEIGYDCSRMECTYLSIRQQSVDRTVVEKMPE